MDPVQMQGCSSSVDLAHAHIMSDLPCNLNNLSLRPPRNQMPASQPFHKSLATALHFEHQVAVA